MGSSKEYLPIPTTESAPKPAKRRFLYGAFAALLLVSLPHVVSWGSVFSTADKPITMSASAIDVALKSAACAQADPLYPSLNVNGFVEGEKDQIVSWLSEAVKIPTEIFDVMGPVGEDPRWEVFYKFADCELKRLGHDLRRNAYQLPDLEKAFPLVHQHLKRTRVVTHALVYEWEGSDPSLKPLLLTGHQGTQPWYNLKLTNRRCPCARGHARPVDARPVRRRV